MTNKEAIKFLEEIEFDEYGCYQSNSWFFGIGDKRNEALQKAIKILQSIEDIKADIDYQYKWLMQTKRTLSDIDIAFEAIKYSIDKHCGGENE